MAEKEREIAVLEIKDQVNIKFHNLDVATRRELRDECKYFQPNARFMASFKLGKWDGTRSYCTIAGSSYIELLERLLPIVLEKYQIEVVDHRTKKPADFSIDHINSNFLSEFKWSKGHKKEGEPINLEDHQVRIINLLLDNKHGIIESSTGSGKCLDYDTEIEIDVENKDFLKFLMESQN